MSRKPGLLQRVKIPEKKLHLTHLEFGGGVSIPKMDPHHRKTDVEDFPVFIKIFCRKMIFSAKSS